MYCLERLAPARVSHHTLVQGDEPDKEQFNNLSSYPRPHLTAVTAPVCTVALCRIFTLLCFECGSVCGF